MKHLLLLALILSVFVAGCVGAESNQTGDTTQNNQTSLGITEAKMIITHTSYSPTKITAKQDDTVRILATTVPGQQDHNHGITIDEYGVNEAVTTTDQNDPKIIEFTADKKGSFKIYCKTCWDGPFGTGHPNIQATLEVV
jgi:nitrous oxide reductase